MPHPFEHPIDRPYMVGLSRSTGWETLDIKGLAGALEVGHRYLHDVLSGIWRPKGGPAIRERARVVALVGMVLSMAPGEVERRIDTAQALRAEERRAKKAAEKLQAGGLGNGQRECTATE